MGHKVHPTGFRLGVVKGWMSRWYAERDYKDILAEDIQIRESINKDLANAAVSRIEIERAAANQILVTIYTAKPGIVIGKSGEKVERLKAALEKKTRKRVRIEIKEIRQPEVDATLVARSIAEQLEKRVSFRRAMKQSVQKAMRSNAKGIKIVVGGRLGGAEIARTEKEVEGKVPLHTLRADIDYGQAEAHTTFGVIGIKVWIYKQDILPSKRREISDTQQEAAPSVFTPREGGDRRSGDRRPPRGDRGDRGPRPQGDRPRGGDRAQGDRPPRPQGERGDRGPRGDRPARPPRAQGDRPQGERPQGDRPQGDRPQGERGPRPPRAQGDRPQGERTERAPRPRREDSTSGERPARRPAAEARTTPPADANQQPETPKTDAGTSEATQSE